jgi:hypothetical protein
MEHPMSEGEGSRKVRKTGSPKEAKALVKPAKEKPPVADRPAPTELPTAHSKLQTEKMEVHHHPQLEHKPKPWKEYLLEYLMIFLAVMTGFFAESYREHVSDRTKETEFMRSMVQDLKADTTSLNFAIKDFTAVFLNVDTMLNCLQSDKPDGNIINRVVSRRFWIYSGYSYNNRTIEQLRNAGNFRLIQNAKVTDSIIIYDNYQNSIMIAQYNDLKGSMYAYKDVEAKAIHYKELKRGTPGGISKPAFITPDKEQVSLYYNRLFIHRTLGYLFIRNMKSARAKAAKLMSFIKKEYRLEDE